MTVTVNSFYKNLALWLLIGLIMVTLFNLFQSGSGKVVDLDYSDFLAKIEEGKVTDVVISENNVKGTLKEGNVAFRTYAPNDPDMIKSLKAKGLKIVAKPPDEKSLWMMVLINMAPFVLFLVVWIFFMRQMQMGGSKAMSFGKSKARLLTEN